MARFSPLGKPGHFARRASPVAAQAGKLTPMRLVPGLLLLPLAAAALAQPASAPIRYPDTQRGDVVDERFGERVADPYRWLANAVRTDAAVRGWGGSGGPAPRPLPLPEKRRPPGRRRARLGDRAERGDPGLPRHPARAGGVSREDARDVRLRKVRPARAQGRALFLHPQRRPPEPVGALRPQRPRGLPQDADRPQ